MRGTDAELLALFAAWRTEIDAEPYSRDDAFDAALRDWNTVPGASAPSRRVQHDSPRPTWTEH